MAAEHTALVLADGRRLSYSETGPSHGFPVLYCHGAIGTPVGRAADLESTTADLDLRFISVNRPGIGASDAAPGRTVLDFVGDIGQLMDALGVERFAAVGVSAGGPYALAIAYGLHERVARVAICSSLSPLWALHRTPGMQRRFRLALTLLAGTPGLWASIGDASLPLIRRHPELLAAVIAAHAAPAERERLRRSDERCAASTSFLEAASGGVRGMIDDYLIYAHDWGFAPEDIDTEVHLWHGFGDPLVPIEHALQLAITLPRCRAFLDPDEGHHFFRRRLPEILALLSGREADAGEGLVTSVADAHELAARRRRSSPAG